MKINKKNTNKSRKYSIFSDGSFFVPDQGRGQELGEVFSPKELIDVMLDQSNFNDLNSSASVFEPGTGTGNFICEILWRKLNKVMSEINEDKITNKNKLVKEYEIRSLLSLASITYNDIDISNINRVKSRLVIIMENKYIDYFSVEKPPNHYLKAISDIASVNGIVGNFLSDKRNNFLVIRYKRESEDEISRYVFYFEQIERSEVALFSDELPIYNDTIKYNDWSLEIAGHDIFKEQPKCKKIKPLKHFNNPVYLKRKSDI